MFIISLLQMWAALFVVSVCVFPLTISLFSRFEDKGYLFGKFIGLIFCGYITWFLSSVKVMPFSKTSCVVGIIIIGVIVWSVFFLTNGKKEGFTHIKGILCSGIRVFIKREVLFLLMFLFFAYMLGNRILDTSTEKTMDYAFMTGMMRTKYFPPVDTWASGTSLNYYYFGQYLMTYLTRISFVEIRDGYMLSMAMIAAGVFSMVYALVRSMLNPLAGILSATMLVFSGNMHYVTSGIFKGFKGYWFPDSTRYIGYFPVVDGDKTITEFPAYSFIIGDLHAHVIDLLLVIILLALLYAWCIRKEKDDIYYIVMLGILLGICRMTNFWDFPIYYVVSGSVILAGNCVNTYKNSFIKGVGITLLQGVMIYGIASFVSLPFSLSFKKMMTGIAFCKTHTMLWQWLLLWGIFTAFVLLFCLYVFYNRKSNRIKLEDGLIILWGLCAIGLVVLPEIIYVKDIYENGYPRANTMFKLTYEAYVLFSIGIGYIVARFLMTNKVIVVKVLGVIGAVFVLISSSYYFLASYQWYGDFWNPKNYKGIDATLYYQQMMAQDMDGIRWLQENITEGQPVILEADGQSYTDNCRVSAVTGLPTVLGWNTHEWLWQNDYEFVAQRKKDVYEIYTKKDKGRLLELLEQYDISYIFIGTKEWEEYPDLSMDLFDEVGERVFELENTKSYIYQVK